jgi:hypothetical protein
MIKTPTALRALAAALYNPARVGGARVLRLPGRGSDACGRPNDPLPGLSSCSGSHGSGFSVYGSGWVKLRLA